MVGRALLLLSLVALALTFALALVACGGGSGTLTKARYSAKVSHLCLASSDQFRELHLTDTIGDYRHYATSIVHIDKEFLKRLASLKPPASIAAAAAGYVRESAKAAQDDKNAIAAAKAGDNVTLHAALAQQNHDSLAAWPYARTMGATGCYIG